MQLAMAGILFASVVVVGYIVAAILEYALEFLEEVMRT